jgi:predicted amidohydrolase
MIKNPKSIAVGQIDCVTGETEPNLNKIRHFAELAARLGAELAVFPECAATGYFVGDRIATLADPPNGPVGRELADIARSARITLVCGLYTRENDVIRNSQKVFDPGGTCLATYHKAHLFASERRHFSAGDAPMVVDTSIGRLGLTVCYDLIFPEYVRRTVELGADIIINSTTWIADPDQRDTWGWNSERVQGLASTRALENVAPLAMACRTGREVASADLAFDCFGPSCVVSPSGKFLARLVDGEGLAVASIDIPARDLDRWRSIATYREDRRPALYGSGGAPT